MKQEKSTLFWVFLIELENVRYFLTLLFNGVYAT